MSRRTAVIVLLPILVLIYFFGIRVATAPSHDLGPIVTPTVQTASSTPLTATSIPTQQAIPSSTPTLPIEPSPTGTPNLVPNQPTQEIWEDTAVPSYTYEVINTYPHDPNAFTQGLVYEDGILYEGTGLYGESTLRETELETGKVVREVALGDSFFGEGITILNDRLYQLTWRENTGFIYEPATFELLADWTYPTEGWGITHDGSRIIMSDGSNRLYFLDPDSLAEIDRVAVIDAQQRPINLLNELEYVKGELFANVWQTNLIVRLNPETGEILGWINLEGLLDLTAVTQTYDVLNGIAYDEVNDRLFVTGKWWPQLYEIKLVPLN